MALAVAAAATLVWLVWLQKAHRRQAWLEGPHHVEQIQILKAEAPLVLPPVRPLRARVARTQVVHE